MITRLTNLHTSSENGSSRGALRAALLNAPLQITRAAIERPPQPDAANDHRAVEAKELAGFPIESFFDEAPAILFVASREGVIQYCNNFLLSYSGLLPASAARTALIDLIHPRDRRRVAIASARAASALTQFSVSCRLLGKSGEYKRFLVRVTPLQRGDNTWWCGIGTEVKEQKQASESASQSHEDLKAIFDSLHDCYVAIDRQLRVTALNQTAEAWLGMSSSSLIGESLKSIAEAVSLTADSAKGQPSTMKTLKRMAEDAMHHGIQGRKQIQSALFSDRWIDLQVVPSNEGALILFRDITGQKFDQLRLTRSQGLVQSSLDSLPGRIAILDAGGVIIAVNKAWRMFQQADGATGAAVVGANYRHYCEAAEVRQGLAAALGGSGTFKTAYQLEASTGRHWYQVTITTFKQSEFLRIVVSHEDVTELVNSRQSVADLHSRLNSLQEEERQRIAIELHDSTAQYLVAAGLNLSRLKDTLIEEKARAVCEEVDDLLDEALKELRTFTYLLHPIGLSNQGLAATLRRFALGLEKRSSLQIEPTLDEGIDHLPFEFQRTVLRIAQEALANAHRHAAATRVELDIDVDGDDLHLRVSDNGRGMQQPPWADMESASGVGIAGMKARVAQFDGTIDFLTSPSGTTVIATIPIPQSIDLVPAAGLFIDGGERRRSLGKEHNGGPHAF
jgi:PAS domain S-box-containing protein